jgi:hypothetical protein
MACAPSAIAALLRTSGRGWFRLGLCPPALSLFIAIAASASPAQEAPPSWPAVAALLGTRCVMCHSGEHAAVELHLDSYEGVVAGSKNGPVVVSGDATASELIRRVRGESQPRMPFLSYPLDADEIALLEDWIEAGLPEGEAVGSN